MGFHDVRFPIDISTGSKGGPRFSTILIQAASGAEWAVQQWDAPLMAWDVGHAQATAAMAQQLRDFFIARAGMANTFRFRDPADYQAPAGSPTVDLGGGSYQLYRAYTSGATTVTRKITKPCDDGSVSFSGGGTLDYATGLISGGSGTPTWSGNFDIHARFGTDEMLLVLRPGFKQWPAVPVHEVLE